MCSCNSFSSNFGDSKQYLNDYKKILITLVTTLILIFFTNNTYQILLIIISGVLGNFLFYEKIKATKISLSIDYKPLSYLFLFTIILIIFPIIIITDGKVKPNHAKKAPKDPFWR